MLARAVRVVRSMPQEAVGAIIVLAAGLAVLALQALPNASEFCHISFVITGLVCAAGCILTAGFAFRNRAEIGRSCTIFVFVWMVPAAIGFMAVSLLMAQMAMAQAAG